MDPAEKRFKQFECGWAIFEYPSDDEVTDGVCPTYEGAELGQNVPFWGPQEYHRCPLRAQST